MEEFIDLGKELKTAMMTITAARVDDRLFEKLADIETRYQSLLNTKEVNDLFIQSNQDSIHHQVAELAEWRARALETARRVDEAIAEFERADRLFSQIGKQVAAQRCRDKANELKLSATGDFDAELERLHIRLKNAIPGTLSHVELLIALGELHSSVNDDSEAVRCLHRAEQELENLGGYASDGELLNALTDSIAAMEGEHALGLSQIENAMRHRALTQRLLLAIGNAYRNTDPTRAAEYEERLRRLDNSSDSNIRELLGQFIDADQDVTTFLQNIRKK